MPSDGPIHSKRLRRLQLNANDIYGFVYHLPRAGGVGQQFSSERDGHGVRSSLDPAVWPGYAGGSPKALAPAVDGLIHGLAVSIRSISFLRRPRSNFHHRRFAKGALIMVHTGEVNQVPGIYRSDCCGVEKSLMKGQRFQQCPSAPGRHCLRSNATWSFVRRTDRTLQRR